MTPPARPPGRRPARFPGSPSSRGPDVAVTCRDRLGGQPAVDIAPRKGPHPQPGGPRPAVLEVELGSQLVAERAVAIRQVVDDALDQVPQLLRLRLGAVQRFDAAGVALLLRAHHRCGERGVRLECADPPRQLLVVLRRTRFDRILTLSR